MIDCARVGKQEKKRKKKEEHPRATPAAFAGVRELL